MILLDITSIYVQRPLQSPGICDDPRLFPHVLGAYMMTIMPAKQRIAPIAS